MYYKGFLSTKERSFLVEVNTQHSRTSGVCEVSLTNDNSVTNLICSLFCCFIMICTVKSVACMNLSSIRADFSAFMCSCCVQVSLWLNISCCSLPDAVFCVCESALHSFRNKTFCLTVCLLFVDGLWFMVI